VLEESLVRFGDSGAVPGGEEVQEEAANHGHAEAGVRAGAIRWMRYGRTTTVERVLEAEKARRLVYTVVKGIPVRNYRAEITLRPVTEGTYVHWSADWDRTLGGRIVHRKLSTLYPIPRWSAGSLPPRAERPPAAQAPPRPERSAGRAGRPR
jgi:polyketide cyclase/dehydrase/lipid transport protein